MLNHLRAFIQPAIAAGLVLAAVASCPGWAQTVGISPEHHAWGRFAPGSWMQVRKLTEEFDEAGRLKTASTTETKTTLEGVDQIGCTLRVEVTVDVAGKRFTAPPRTMRVGFYGESDGEQATIRKTGSETLEIGGTTADCTILEATLNGPHEKIVSTIYYCESVAPFVLKRETQVTDKDGKQVHRHTIVDTVAVRMPYKVLAEMKTAAFLRTFEKRADGASHTLEVYCMDVPGGVVAHSSKEFDEAGRMVRRSTLELIDYAVVDEFKPEAIGTSFRQRVRRPILPFRSK